VTTDLKKRAQSLYWVARELDELCGPEAARPVHAELAVLHKELAEQRLADGDSGAWIDVFAAVTCLGRSGDRDGARGLLAVWREKAEHGRLDEICQELDSLQNWLSSPTAPPHIPSEEKPWAVFAERLVLSQVRRELSAAW